MMAELDQDGNPVQTWRERYPYDERMPRSPKRYLLSKFDYDNKDHELVGEPDPLIVGRALADLLELLLEGVLDLLAGIFEAGLRLVSPALVASPGVAGEIADRFLRLSAEIVDLVLCLVRCAHNVISCVVPNHRSTSSAGRGNAHKPNCRSEPGKNNRPPVVAARFTRAAE
jgi:hypothetical protein